MSNSGAKGLMNWLVCLCLYVPLIPEHGTDTDSCPNSWFTVMNRDTSILLLFLRPSDCFISDLSYYETSRNFEPTNRWEVSQRNVSIRKKKKGGHFHDSRRNTNTKTQQPGASKTYIVPDKYSCDVVLTIYGRYNMCYEKECFKV